MPSRPGRAPRDRDASARPRGRGSEWVRTLLLVAAMSAALWGFHPVLQDLSWWLAGTGQVLLVLGVAALVRARARRWWTPPLIGALAGAAVITPAFAPDTGLAVLIPGPESVDALRTLARAGFDSISAQAIPATPERGIVLLIVAAIGAIAVVADVVVLEWRLTAFAAAPLLGLLAVPVAVQTGTADPVVWLVTAALYLALLRVGLRATPLPIVAVTGAIVLAGSLVVPAILPPVTPAEDPAITGPGARANPFIELGADLRRGANVTALSYSTAADAPSYLRLSTLSDFRGDVWAPDPVGQDAAPLSAIPVAQGLDASVETTPLRLRVSVDRVGGSWLPLPYPATEVQGLNGQWRIDRSGLVGRGQNAGVDGQNYTVRYLDVEPTAAQLRTAPKVTGSAFDRYLALPDDVPAVVGDTAREVTADAQTDYQRAVALQDWFRNDFTYSEQTPVDDGYDGTGIGVIAEFLQKKTGYCVHFSSTMAVMARQLGIPSRVVVGYLPGTRNGTDDNGDTRFRVSSNELHAWPELYFSGVGWVRFEPTASRGDVPSYADPATDDSTDPSASAAPTESAAPSTSAAPSIAPSSSASTAPDATTRTGGSAPIAFGAGGILALVILVLLIPAIIRRAQRAWRFSRLRGGGGGPAAWAELRDTARDHGIPAPPTETPGDLAERLAPLLDPPSAAALGRLLDAVEREAYARTRGSGLDPDDLRDALGGIAATSTPRDRARAVLLPPSLVDRVGAVARA